MGLVLVRTFLLVYEATVVGSAGGGGCVRVGGGGMRPLCRVARAGTTRSETPLWAFLWARLLPTVIHAVKPHF